MVQNDDKKMVFLTSWLQLYPGALQPVGEFNFDPTPSHSQRAFDWCWPVHRLAVEVDGGTAGKRPGRHNSFMGFQSDTEKLNIATMRGWRVFRWTTQYLDRNPNTACHLVYESLMNQLPLAPAVSYPKIGLVKNPKRGQWVISQPWDESAEDLTFTTQAKLNEFSRGATGHPLQTGWRDWMVYLTDVDTAEEFMVDRDTGSGVTRWVFIESPYIDSIDKIG